MHFAEKLKAAREAAGLSQEQFAEALGISRQAVSKWETAQSYPDTENLMAAAQILGLSVDELALEQVRDSRPGRFAPRLIIGLLAAGACALCGYAGWTLHPQPAQPAASAAAPALSSASQDSTDWLNTPESVAMQIAAQQFATAFFTQDVEGMQALLFWGQPAEPYPEQITLSYTVLKWHPEDLAAGGEIEVSLQFQSEGSDTAQYLTLTLLKADGWQVTGYALEG